MHTILTEDFLREFTTLEMLVPFYLPLLGLLLLASVRLSTPWLTVVSVFLAILYYILAHLIFRYANVVVDIPGLLSTLVGSTILLAAYQFHLESKSKAVLRSTFDAYFPPQVVEKVMSQRENLISSATKKEITILFSDIKDFTRLTADIDASKVRALLNEYFEQMIEIVFRHQGTLDKFIGDGIMVFFGDPEDQSDHAARCVRAALDMQKAARKLCAKWEANGDMPLQIRVGINTGVVIVGNMGSHRRLTYTAIGEPVNLAARMESNAPVGGILITKRTFELLDDSVKTIAHEPVSAKGYADPIEAFEIPVV